jgi:hypothetical protein
VNALPSKTTKNKTPPIAPDKRVWTADELIGYTTEMHTLDIDYRGGIVRVHWKELELNEAPDLSKYTKDFPEDMDDKVREAKLYTILMREKAWTMIEKAQREDRDKCEVIWSRQQFDRWPDTVRGAVCWELWGLTEKLSQNFTDGLQNLQKP